MCNRRCSYCQTESLMQVGVKQNRTMRKNREEHRFFPPSLFARQSSLLNPFLMKENDHDTLIRSSSHTLLLFALRLST